MKKLLENIREQMLEYFHRQISSGIRNENRINIYIVNPLSANVGYARHDAGVTCGGHSVSYRQNY